MVRIFEPNGDGCKKALLTAYPPPPLQNRSRITAQTVHILAGRGDLLEMRHAHMRTPLASETAHVLMMAGVVSDSSASSSKAMVWPSPPCTQQRILRVVLIICHDIVALFPYTMYFKRRIHLSESYMQMSYPGQIIQKASSSTRVLFCSSL